MNLEDLSVYRIRPGHEVFYVPDFVTVNEYINYLLLIAHELATHHTAWNNSRKRKNTSFVRYMKFNPRIDVPVMMSRYPKPRNKGGRS
jgi:hypothetical protein